MADPGVLEMSRELEEQLETQLAENRASLEAIVEALEEDNNDPELLQVKIRGQGAKERQRDCGVLFGSLNSCCVGAHWTPQRK